MFGLVCPPPTTPPTQCHQERAGSWLEQGSTGGAGQYSSVTHLPTPASKVAERGRAGQYSDVVCDTPTLTSGDICTQHQVLDTGQ